MAIKTRHYAIVFAPFDASRIGGFQMKGKAVALYPTMNAARKEAARLDTLVGHVGGAYRAISWPVPLQTTMRGEFPDE